MTVHIALAGSSSAVLVSDSQGSTSQSKIGGWQKQFAGPDFLLGVAGNGAILDALFHHLDALTTLTSVALVSDVEQFLQNEVMPDQWNSIQAVAVLQNTPLTSVRTYDPSTFRHFGPDRNIGSIGSGSMFVHDALSGVGATQWRSFFPGPVVEQVTFALHLADAANQSLTVNDAVMVGILSDGKSYIIAEEQIAPVHVPPAIASAWSNVTNSFEEIVDLASTVNSEIANAYQQMSSIWRGQFQVPATTSILSHNAEVARGMSELSNKLSDYFTWYDSILGR